MMLPFFSSNLDSDSQLEHFQDQFEKMEKSNGDETQLQHNRNPTVVVVFAVFLHIGKMMQISFSTRRAEKEVDKMML